VTSGRAQLGVRVSDQDLPRIVDSIAYRSGVPRVDRRNLLGPETVDTTIRYAGGDSDNTLERLACLEQDTRESLTVQRL